MWNDIGNHGQIKGKIDDWAWHYNLEFKCGQTCLWYVTQLQGGKLGKVFENMI